MQTFNRKIIINDKALFLINDYVNKFNYRIWDNVNPHEVHQMHTQKFAVCRGFWAGGAIGTF